MYKKIIIILVMLVLTGCTTYNLNNMTLEDSVNLAINQNKNLYNVNNIGYRYYLPRSFILGENRDNIQVIEHKGREYYLNVDLVSYYNKAKIEKNTEDVVYKYMDLKKGKKTGFLEIVKDNDYFFIKMVYNYAIVEAQVEKSELKETVVNMAYILTSIKYNDNIINNKLGEDVLVFNETSYKIFGPKNILDTKTHSYYLEKYDNYTGDDGNTLNDPDVIENY